MASSSSLSSSSADDNGCYLPPDPNQDEGSKHNELHDYAWMATGIAAFIACILSFILIYKHLKNYTIPKEQKLILRILLMVPIYAIDSFLSFRFVWLSVFFDLGRDCYEAFVIYTFFSLLVEYIGGYRAGKEIFANHEPFTLILPLCCFKLKPKRGFLRSCKRLTLQYVIIRPLFSAFAVVMQATHVYCPGNYSPRHGYIYVTIVYFISVTIAMYSLVLFYAVAKKQLTPKNPIPKFLSVKFVIFLSFWQSIVVSGLVYIDVIKATTYWSTADVAEGVQDALLCGEMLIAAILHFFVFTHHDYIGSKPTPLWKSVANAFDPRDIMEDLHHSFLRRPTQRSTRGPLSYSPTTSRESTLETPKLDV